MELITAKTNLRRAG